MKLDTAPGTERIISECSSPFSEGLHTLKASWKEKLWKHSFPPKMLVEWRVWTSVLILRIRISLMNWTAKNPNYQTPYCYLSSHSAPIQCLDLICHVIAAGMCDKELTTHSRDNLFCPYSARPAVKFFLPTRQNTTTTTAGRIVSLFLFCWPWFQSPMVN